MYTYKHVKIIAQYSRIIIIKINTYNIMQYIYYTLQNTSSITSLFAITSRQYIFGMNYFSLFYLLYL